MKSLTMQGCAYNINEDRVLVSIDCISNQRPEGNISGTLRIDFCASSSHTSQNDSILLASTHIGELFGQHFLENCQYDLLFQQPPEGSWQLFLQLSEWDGVVYSPVDTIGFALPYIYTPENENSQEDTQLPKSAPKTTLEQPEHYQELNRVKSKTLRALKGVQKKVLEKLISERPFRSKKAVLNVKGMGPKVLDKILDQLIKEK
ncbi:helix-hairpin-helix domain-containing protein [Marinomonas sp. C2222]|uniref:Helix-hairpin-helix domain-containing protein n=1 Tax=Marinomonas sargassi TaxID=2984494 RepID=A0ABT2YQC3_9GAMM|nr:helix-hairpin-helix domain-containing protein [Marinomonas sargassi]MCV2402085.1 helix-hairpin-helix domain-containing protein [Marinomonas sargassi]